MQEQESLKTRMVAQTGQNGMLIAYIIEIPV
jgi:hypothetical protein